MFDPTPSFAQNPSLTISQHYVSDQNYYQNTTQTYRTDYIKILEFNRSDSYGSFLEQSVSRSSNSPSAQQESQRRKGFIVRRNQHCVSSYSNWNTRDIADEEVESRDLF